MHIHLLLLFITKNIATVIWQNLISTLFACNSLINIYYIIFECQISVISHDVNVLYLRYHFCLLLALHANILEAIMI